MVIKCFIPPQEMIKDVAAFKYGQNVSDFLTAHLDGDYGFDADALNTEGCSDGVVAVGDVYTDSECLKKLGSSNG